MSKFNYSGMTSSATSLIKKYGLKCHFLKKKTSLISSGNVTDKDPGYEEPIEVSALILSPSESKGLGTTSKYPLGIKDNDISLIVTSDHNYDLMQYNKVSSNGVTYNINRIDRMRPASDTIFYYVWGSK